MLTGIRRPILREHGQCQQRRADSWEVEVQSTHWVVDLQGKELVMYSGADSLIELEQTNMTERYYAEWEFRGGYDSDSDDDEE